MINEIYQNKTDIKLKAIKQNNKTILDSILESRGIENKEEYFSAKNLPIISPFSFSDMEKARDIITDAIKNREKILIWGDFDADGVTSTAILYKTFEYFGADFTHFIPDRVNLGHGINLKELLRFISKEKVKVLITVDCGISNYKEVQLVKSMGIKTIITDHHEPPEMLPNANCILNPHANNSIKSSLSVKEIHDISYLSGAGVALMLAFALLEDDCSELKDELLVLASVGTIADVVPLKGENRKIAAQGIKKINEGCHKGIQTLFKRLELEREVNSCDIAFLLAPRINSAGRLSTPDKSFKLLVSQNKYSIDNAINELEELNSQRQAYCDSTYEQALSMISAPSNCIVLYNPGWLIGVIGIVASKLTDKFNLPVFLITLDKKSQYRCSARGVNGIDISKILTRLKDNFVGYGGHSLAGGFSADSTAVSLDTIKKNIYEAVEELKETSDTVNLPEADIELEGDDISFELIEEINKMEPFGAENEKPVFLFRDAKVISQRTIGKNSNHLSFSVLKDDCEFNCLFWRRKLLGVNQGDFLDFAFKLDINEFNGEEKIQLITEYILNDKLQENYLSPIKVFDHRQKTDILDKVDEYVKNKNGEVKVWAKSISVKKILEKYENIKSNILNSSSQKVKSLMLFDYPASKKDFIEIIKNTSPANLHVMNTDIQKNPDAYISNLCGMLKYAAHNKNGNIDLLLISEALGVDESCLQVGLELLEKIGAIQILDVDKIEFIKAPLQDAIRQDALYEIFKDEIKRVTDFKEFFKTTDPNTLQELCKI